ncbi:hypothetical protein GCM10027566_37750 [Arachidicoccus ginsenosidivorans]
MQKLSIIKVMDELILGIALEAVRYLSMMLCFVWLFNYERLQKIIDEMITNKFLRRRNPIDDYLGKSGFIAIKAPTSK